MATILAHLQKEPIPPSRRTEIEIPSELDEIILSCLAKDPTQRPASAGTLSRMLAACSGVPPWRQEDAESWWRINAPEMVFNRSNVEGL